MSDQPTGDLRVEVTDHVATVTLDRPPVNAIDNATYAEIAEVFTSFRDNRDVRVAIFTAAGDRAFIAGIDLKTYGQPAGRSAGRPRDRSRATVA